MGRISWREGVPDRKDFVVGRSSRLERFPGKGVPGRKDFLVRRSYRQEGFPGEKEFPTGKISWWEGVPGRKDFLVGRNFRWEFKFNSLNPSYQIP